MDGGKHIYEPFQGSENKMTWIELKIVFYIVSALSEKTTKSLEDIFCQ